MVIKLYSSEDSIIILGASGHAKVVASTLRSSGFNLSGFYDDNEDFWDKPFFGSRVLGPIKAALEYPYKQSIFVAIGTNTVREKIALLFRKYVSIAVVSPKAIVDASVVCDVGSIVMAGAVLQAEAQVGRHCIINTNASVDHECVLLEFSQVSPGAILCGNVTLGQHSYVGAGSVVKQGVVIGSNVLIGAGSVVVHDIPDNVIVFGNPARVIKEGVFV